MKNVVQPGIEPGYLIFILFIFQEYFVDMYCCNVLLEKVEIGQFQKQGQITTTVHKIVLNLNAIQY